MKKVGIILVNYKDYAERFLDECRDSLRIQSYPSDRYRVYIVDNSSTEKSADYINKRYPDATLIKRDDGNYSAANNAGIKRAVEDGCTHFVVANMDTKFDKDWLKELVIAVNSDKNIGMVQSKILLYPKNKEEWRRSKINSLGNIINFLGFGFTSNYGQFNKDIVGLPEIKGYASGCSFIIRKDVLDKIGYYDEEYYMYHDDVEMGWRAKLAGYKIVLAPKSIVYHKYEFSRSISMVYYMERNRYLAMFHYYQLSTILVLLPFVVLVDIGMIIYSIANGWFKEKIRSSIYFLDPLNWVKILRKRRRVKFLRVKSERSVVSDFDGRILFQEINNPILKYIINPMLNLCWKIIKNIIF